MQRRAAALYGAFFLVLAVGSYGMIAAASAPSITFADPDYRLSNGSQFTVDDRAYDVTIEDGEATLDWTDPEGVYTETWEGGDEVLVGETNYTVSIPDGADPPVVELTERRPLPEGVETTEINDTEYVVLEGDEDTRELVPLDTYLDEQYGPAETRTLEVSDGIDYRGNQTTVIEVTNESATIEWRAPQAQTIGAAEGDVLDLNGVEFVVHFPDAETLLLDRDVSGYERQAGVQETFDQRMNGLWGISILSSVVLVVLLAFAYLPSRY